MTWVFKLSPRSGESLEAALRRSVISVLGLLDDFARPRQASWTTSSQGEDAAELDARMIDEENVERTFEAHADTVGVTLDLDLLLAGGFQISDGASLLFELPDPETPDDRPEELRLVLFLHTDIYAPRTFGQERDNRELAAQNAPRFNRFLTRLREELGARPYELDAEGYEDQVDATGFRVD